MKVTAQITFDVDVDAYAIEYGTSAKVAGSYRELQREAREYAIEQAVGAVELQFARLGWASINEDR